MEIKWSNEGKIASEEELRRCSSTLDITRDIYISGEDKLSRYNMVGFLSTNEDDLMVVFPKHFIPHNIEEDGRKLFEVINYHMANNADIYLGAIEDEMYKSNFPFSSLFRIYKFYVEKGLVFEERKKYTTNPRSKINWKQTISKTKYYINNESIEAFPFYYEEKRRFYNYITDAMVYAIDYSQTKFGPLLSLEKIKHKYTTNIQTQSFNRILKELKTYMGSFFRDDIVKLLNDLINFYSRLNVGGKYYLKHYMFSSIWEDMVEKYLNTYFEGMSPGGLMFSSKPVNKHTFNKVTVHPDIANPANFVTFDHYSCSQKTQYIFDAKYKNEAKGIDYKQFSYHIMMMNLRDDINGPKKYENTFSSLIVSSETDYCDINFKIDKHFNKELEDVIIYEYHLSVNKAIDCYLDN